MDSEDLRAFMAVVDTRGFRSAAKALFISQPSVSRAVTRLEGELGVTLFTRGRSGTELTVHGEALRNGVPGILAKMERVRVETVGRLPTTLRLGVAPAAAGSFLARFLSTWIPQHHELRIVMLHGGAAGLRTRLENDECDAAIISSPVPRSFEHYPLATIGLVACIPPNHRLAQSEAPLAVAELHREAILVNGGSFLTTRLFAAACQLVGADPDIVYECEVDQTLAALVEAGLGIAVMGDNVDLRGFDIPRRALHNGDGSVLSFDLHVAWRRDAELAPAAREFLGALSASQGR